MKKIGFDTLKTFCAEESLRPQYLFPCLKDGYWCATDGRILVMAKDSVCEDNIQCYDESLGKYPNVFAVFNPRSFDPSCEVRLCDMEGALSKVPREKGYTKKEIETEYETCEACFGSGQLTNEVLFRGSYIEYNTECPICHGYGKVPVSNEYDPEYYNSPKEFVDHVKTETGQMVIKDDAVLSIDNRIYIATTIDKVRALMSFLGVDSAVIGYNKNLGRIYTVFHFSGVFVVLSDVDFDRKDVHAIRTTEIS